MMNYDGLSYRIVLVESHAVAALHHQIEFNTISPKDCNCDLV